MKEKMISLLEGILWSKKQVSVMAASQVNNGGEILVSSRTAQL
jgi:hypothetical protein